MPFAVVQNDPTSFCSLPLFSSIDPTTSRKMPTPFEWTDRAPPNSHGRKNARALSRLNLGPLETEESADGTLDIYLNIKVVWHGIPAPVWRYTIGGYKVMKKWLFYRERGVLG
jgi:hypothetical protein